MTAIEFDKNSWHYKIAKMGGLRTSDRYPETDICEYVRKFLFGGLALLFLAAMGFCVFFVEVHFIVAVIVSIIQWTWVIDGFAFVGFVLTSLIGFIFAVAYVVKFAEDHKRKKYPHGEPAKEPGFIKLAYHSWKDKYCVRINIIDKTVLIEEPIAPSSVATTMAEIIKDSKEHDEP